MPPASMAIRRFAALCNTPRPLPAPVVTWSVLEDLSITRKKPSHSARHCEHRRCVAIRFFLPQRVRIPTSAFGLLGMTWIFCFCAGQSVDNTFSRGEGGMAYAMPVSPGGSYFLRIKFVGLPTPQLSIFHCQLSIKKGRAVRSPLL